MGLILRKGDTTSNPHNGKGQRTLAFRGVVVVVLCGLRDLAGHRHAKGICAC
jgi:hypothetical protein